MEVSKISYRVWVRDTEAEIDSRLQREPTEVAQKSKRPRLMHSYLF